MSQYNDTGYGTVTLAAEIGKFLRVLNDGNLADNTAKGVGSTMSHGVAGDVVGVAFTNKQGTLRYTANAAFTVDAEVFAAAGGKVAPAGTVSLGFAMEAASGDNSVFEVMPH